MREQPKTGTKIRVPESVLSELDAVEAMDWSEGISLDDLIGWINEVVARFRPEEVGESTRAVEEFTPRSFRHYQTLGCIDRPGRSGRKAAYGFRHYLQGLLVRKLLWERVPSDQITAVMRGRTDADYKRILFEGVELVSMGQGGGDHGGSRTWTRTEVAPGVELHTLTDMGTLGDEEVDRVLEKVREVLKG
jgi:hypothetical protein